MSNVTLTIAGRDYTLACAPGEEDHLAMLGRMIDGRIAGQGIAGQSEARRLLYAALLLADELHEQETGRPPSPSAEPDAATALEALAERLERTADKLETGAEGRTGA